jgi:uncharacterized membrane protein YagU involved in acid resistance
MTAVMRRFHRNLAEEDQYPLPPREIISSIAPDLPGTKARDLSMLTHFAYGAACGAALATVRRRPSLGYGVAGGIGIWIGSYLGWLPGLKILKPATEHPAQRNAGMILAHAVWGAAYALTQSGLLESERILKGGPLKDLPIKN